MTTRRRRRSLTLTAGGAVRFRWLARVGIIVSVLGMVGGGSSLAGVRGAGLDAPGPGTGGVERTVAAPAPAIASGSPVQQVDPESVFADLRWRNIGPANMMGRIAAIDALDTDYRHMLIASASGGVFKTLNGGITWDPIFDGWGPGSIGAVALNQQDPDIIWVGTGEAANRNSSGWGDGVYRSTDGGETFEHLGLEDTHHIAELALHPEDPDVAWAASPGHLWGYSGSRGLFKTSDGGRSWEKVGGGLPDDGRTGATEIIMEPGNSDVLYAGMYHRLRQPATMYSGGEQGGVFKSTDGGETWERLAGGLPEGPTGMIDISIHRADPSILVAAVEADQDIPYDDSVPAWENPPGGGIYISRDRGETWTYLLRHDTRPFYHGQVEIDPSDPDRIYVVSRDFRVSSDGGRTWRGKWWGGGGDDHDLWIAPYDSDIFVTATDQGAHITLDGGETVLSYDNMAIGQYYKVGVDMRDPYWVIGGLQDNAIWIGPSNSRENRGILNMHNTWLAEGDGFASLVDPEDWRTIYAVNHVGFAVRMNRETRDYTFITPTPETVVNLDDVLDVGFEEEPIRYTIDPGEHWFFRDRPERPLMPPQFRFNWNSPLVMSPANPRVLYFGSNHLFRTVDRGDTWRIISPDLTTNDPELRNPSEQGGLTRNVTGGENHFTIFTIAESPLDPALLWVGTDDGNVQVSPDGGATWTNVRDRIPGIPDRIWVSKVVASSHDPDTAYASFDNHRLDDMRPYVFRTTDRGETWTDVSGDLPDGHSVYVVVEDPVNPDLLFVGTEFGAFGTLDGGQRWVKLDNNLPDVAVRDLVIHPRDGDMVAGTHGRSIWILDDLSPLRQARPETLAAPVALLDSRTATRWVRINLGRKQPAFLFRGENPPYGALLHYWLAAPAGQVELEVSELFGDRSVVLEGPAEPGVHRVRWDLSFPVTEAARQRFRAALGTVLDRLDQRVRDPELRPRIAEIRRRLDAADSDRALDDVRRELVTEFNAYAGGRPFFPPRLEGTEADPGIYRVTLDVDGVITTGTVEVRADPLEAEGPGA